MPAVDLIRDQVLLREKGTDRPVEALGVHVRGVHMAAAYLDKGTGELRQKSLAEGLGLPFEGYVIFKDYVTHLEYIRSCEELWQKGMYVELHAYQHHVFMDWRFVDDSNWELVNSNLNGAGVESMQGKWDEMFGVKEEVSELEDEVVEEVKVKKTLKKAVAKKPAVKKTSKPVAKKKSTASKAAVKKSPAKVTKSKPKASGKKVVKTPAKK